MSLQSELDARKAEWLTKAPANVVQAYAEGVERQRASGQAERALGVGAAAPDAELANARGGSTRLSDLWQTGPIVVLFYRGGWCPYCNIELRAYQKRLTDFQDAGAKLVAVSPELPDHTLDTAQKNDLAFDVLSDSRAALAEGFGIAFDLPDDLVAIYAKNGIELPKRNGDGKWRLPIPATFVIDRSGRIIARHVDPEYRARFEPDDALTAIRRSQT